MLSADEQKRIRGIFSKKKSQARKQVAEKEIEREEDYFAFGDVDVFVQWWDQQSTNQMFQCAYCKTPIKLIADLIDAKMLGTRKVRSDGERGRNFELERKHPEKCYEPDNCVLVCMFCNNDKSYIYMHEDYEIYFGPARKKHFEHLAKQFDLKKSGST